MNGFSTRFLHTIVRRNAHPFVSYTGSVNPVDVLVLLTLTPTLPTLPGQFSPHAHKIPQWQTDRRVSVARTNRRQARLSSGSDRTQKRKRDPLEIGSVPVPGNGLNRFGDHAALRSGGKSLPCQQHKPIRRINCIRGTNSNVRSYSPISIHWFFLIKKSKGQD